MAKNVDAINLLPNKGNGFLTQLLNWTLTIGRLLIILTETIALSTFLYRFSLDMKIVDLHDEIKLDSTIVQNFVQEDTFRSLQHKIALAKTYDAQSNQIPAVFHDIIQTGKGKITFNKITVSTDVIKIEAQASTANSLTLFVSALKKDPAIKSISVDKVEAKTSTAYVLIGITAYPQTTTPAPKQISVQNVSGNSQLETK